MLGTAEGHMITSVSESIPEQRSNMIFTKQYLDIKKYIKGETNDPSICISAPNRRYVKRDLHTGNSGSAIIGIK